MTEEGTGRQAVALQQLEEMLDLEGGGGEEDVLDRGGIWLEGLPKHREVVRPFGLVWSQCSRYGPGVRSSEWNDAVEGGNQELTFLKSGRREARCQ